MRALAESCGVHMNTWFVGNIPIGHYCYLHPESHGHHHPKTEERCSGKKVFFMKARIYGRAGELEKQQAPTRGFPVAYKGGGQAGCCGGLLARDQGCFGNPVEEEKTGGETLTSTHRRLTGKGGGVGMGGLYCCIAIHYSRVER